MSDKHTQGRLTTSESTEHWGRTNAHIDDADGNTLGSIWCGTTEQNKANARRLVACWNACEGIRTEALEHRSHMLKAGDDQITMLTAQRDELLGALTVLKAQCELMAASDWRKWEELASPEEFERWVKSRAAHMAVQATAAIAKAEASK